MQQWKQWKLKVKVKFTYRQIYGYIKLMENEKCELVGKGLRCMQEMLFTILVACFMSILGWLLTLHLPKLVERIYDLRHRLAIITL